MTIYKLDPLTDERWPEIVNRHPSASAFHTRGWLEALHRTYGYEPVVYTTCGPGKELTDGLPLCRINSWLTGRRLVSVPFADHCEPLADDPGLLSEILGELAKDAQRENIKYVELRPITPLPAENTGEKGFAGSQEFFFHIVDITPEPDELFSRFHRTCVRVKVGRAERENLTYEEGCSDRLISQFYDLLLLTRRKYHVPPPPLMWFRNLVECVGDGLTIRVALKDGVPVSSIMTILHHNVCLYKYTGSNQNAAKMGGTHALVWRAILQSREDGATKLDFGRTDIGNDTLVEYKDRWASVRSNISYYRCPASAADGGADGWKSRLAKQVFGRMPNSLLRFTGRMLYKHIG